MMMRRARQTAAGRREFTGGMGLALLSAVLLAGCGTAGVAQDAKAIPKFKRVLVDKGEKWKKLVIDTDGSHDIVAADLDGDGDLDIVGANHADVHPVILWENQLASKTFAAASPTSQQSAAAVPARDVEVGGELTPLRVSGNRKYLEDASGKPFFLGTRWTTWARP